MISFTKAHACGNDFLIINRQEVKGHDLESLTQRLCERNTGIGADGIEFFEWTGENSGKITLYNADGSIAEISGNGTRCVAAWMAEERNAQLGDQFAIETDAGVRVCTIREFRDSTASGPTVLVTTDMDVPEFERMTIELADGSSIDGIFVSMGNPHFVIVYEPARNEYYASDVSESNLASLDYSINGRSWEDIGQEICFHADFPDQTNVEFVHPLGSVSEPLTQVALRIFERGVGPTSSSGTGTSAAGTAVIAYYEGQSPLEVAAPGGIQTVEWQGEGERLYLTGPAALIAHGEAW